MTYTAKQWLDGETIDAAELNALEQAVEAAHGLVAAERLPSATSTERGIVSLGQVQAEASKVASEAMSSAVTTDELFQSFYVTSLFGSPDAFGSFAPHTLFTAPYNMRLTRVIMVFDKWNLEAKSSYEFTFRFQKYDPAGKSASQIVAKSTATESVVAGKPWNFDTVSWDSAAQEVAAGQTLQWRGTRTGDIKAALPLSITVGYVPA